MTCFYTAESLHLASMNIHQNEVTLEVWEGLEMFTLDYLLYVIS